MRPMQRASKNGMKTLAVGLAVSVLLGWAMPAGAQTAYTWTNDAGDLAWSTTANWDPSGLPGANTADTVTLSTPAAERYVEVDVETTIGALTMANSGNNRMRLDTNLTVDVVYGTHGDINWSSLARIYPQGHTLTLKRSHTDNRPMPQVWGTGTIVKDGPGRLVVGACWETGFGGYFYPFQGDWVIKQGLLTLQYTSLKYSESAEVQAGATIRIDGNVSDTGQISGDLPQHTRISGTGDSNVGALYLNVAKEKIFSSRITVENDATINVADAAALWRQTGDMDGDGALTIKGLGTFRLERSDYTYSNRITVASSAKLTVLGMLSHVTNITVQSGATLTGVQEQFPNADVVVETDGTWVQAYNATWIGPSGSNDGGNWSGAANWNPPFVPTDLAVLPAPSTVRTVSVDTVSSLASLDMAHNANNRMGLDADMQIDMIRGNHTDPNWNGRGRIYLNGKTLTVQTTYSSRPGCTLWGTGLVVKQGDGEYHLGASNDGASSRVFPFEGGWRIEAGTLRAYYCWLRSSTNMVVQSGATLRLVNTDTEIPQNLSLSGAGATGRAAALYLDQAATYRTQAGNISVAEGGATARIPTSGTFPHTGTLTGPGVLTLAGGGKLDLNGTFKFAAPDGNGNRIVVTQGILDIAGCTLELVGASDLPGGEFVMADYSSATGSLAGDEFLAVVGATESHVIEYNGTATHPDCVVLVHTPPPKGTVITIR